MKNAYPILLTPDEGGYSVYIPDFDINTQAGSLAEAMEMARDAIGMVGIALEDDKKPLPAPSPLGALSKKSRETLSLVDVDFADYRRKSDLRVVKKNCTLPSWLCYEAEKAHINFSGVLQAALKKELHIDE
ncbi:MAG: type II toxin-antitoxin system HicB family antitoxin [Clostridia bacterium]|nr:type II toxin-antitoxin system HicB family antitoxin [Clostridia bacterium]